MSVADSLREGTAGDSPGWPDRLIGFNPVITRDAGVMFVDLAVTILPGVPLAGMDAQPVDELLGSEIGLVDPAVDEINDRVTRVMGNPRATQSSPRRCCVTKSSLFPHPRDGDHPPEANDPARFFYDSSHELSPELLFSVSLTCDVLTFPLSVS